MIKIIIDVVVAIVGVLKIIDLIQKWIDFYENQDEDKDE